MKTTSQFLPNLLDEIAVHGNGVAQQIETACAGPVLLRPTREAENESEVRKFHRVETRQAAPLEINVHARGKRQQWFNQAESPATPRANRPRFSVTVFRTTKPSDLFPRFKNDARVFT